MLCDELVIFHLFIGHIMNCKGQRGGHAEPLKLVGFQKNIPFIIIINEATLIREMHHRFEENVRNY